MTGALPDVSLYAVNQHSAKNRNCRLISLAGAKFTSENWESGDHVCKFVVVFTVMGASAAFVVPVGICIAKLRQSVPPVRNTSTGMILFITGLLNALHHASVAAALPDTGQLGKTDGSSFTGFMPWAFSLYSKH